MTNLISPIETERLILREFQEKDWETLYEYGHKEEFYRFLPIPKQTPETTQEFVKQALENQQKSPRVHYQFIIIFKPEEKVVGTCNIFIADSDNKLGRRGMAVNPVYWNKGIATEAGKAILRFGFQELGMHRIFAMCDVDNKASAKVMEKCGMKYEGTLREDSLVRGEWRDSLLYAILEDEIS